MKQNYFHRLRLVIPELSRIAVAASTGHLLVFEARQLPELARGKGNKLVQIPPAQLGTDTGLPLFVLPPLRSLRVIAGKRHLTLSPSDLDNFVGERARRGNFTAWIPASRTARGRIVRLLWFVSKASHFEALEKLIKQAGLADAQSYHRQSRICWWHLL